MRKTFIVNGTPVRVDNLSIRKGEVSFDLEGKHYTFAGRQERDGRLVMKHDGHNLHGFVGKKNAKGAHPVMLDGLEAAIHLPTNGRKQGAGASGAQASHKAPMPGKVQRVLVEAGETVKAGQVLLVLEAMKLQLDIEAAYDGVVSKLCHPVGSLVQEGALLVEVEKTDAA